MSLRKTLLAALALACALPALAAAGPGKRGEPANKEAQLVRVVYPVADLVVPVGGVAGKQQTTLECRLMELIGNTIQPASWADRGGRGALHYYPLGMALVVTQTAEVQAEVADLIAALRRLQDLQVCVEMRVVQVSEDIGSEFFAKVGFETAKAELGAKPVATAFLTEKELYPWLKVFQADRATDITSSPKLMMLNGQQATMLCGQTMPFVTEYKVVRDGEQVKVVPHVETVELGLKCDLLPIVSADRRCVQLKVDFRQSSLGGPVAVMPVTIKVAREGGADQEFQGLVQQPQVGTLAFKQISTIPDGRTMAVLLGKVMVDARNDEPASFLSRIPYLSRLVRNVGWGREGRAVFLFVTPRVIVNEEEEQIFLNDTPMPRP